MRLLLWFEELYIALRTLSRSHLCNICDIKNFVSIVLHSPDGFNLNTNFIFYFPCISNIFNRINNLPNIEYFINSFTPIDLLIHIVSNESIYLFLSSIRCWYPRSQLMTLRSQYETRNPIFSLIPREKFKIKYSCSTNHNVDGAGRNDY